IIGSNTMLHYGPALVIDRGPKITSTVSNQGLSAKLPKLFASLYSLMTIADTVLPLAQPALRDKMGSAEGAARVLGVGGALLTGALLAAWAGAEIAFTTTAAVKTEAARATQANLEKAIEGAPDGVIADYFTTLSDALLANTEAIRLLGGPPTGPGDTITPA